MQAHLCDAPSQLQAQTLLWSCKPTNASPIVYFGDIHPPVSTQDFQLAASMDVLPLPQGHKLLDDIGQPAIPHVLPGNAGQARVGEDVGIAQTQMMFRERPVLLCATCKHTRQRMTLGKGMTLERA